MPAKKLDGESLATKIKTDLAERVKNLKDKGIQPGLGTILVGDDAPSRRYVEMKHNDCAKIGIESHHQKLPEEASFEDVAEAIQAFNTSSQVHCFLVQYPFPGGLDYNAALEMVNPKKDADGLHPTNLGRLISGAECPLPCTPAGIIEILSEYEIPTQGANAVIVGRGLTVGKPLAVLLARKDPRANAAVTCVHTGVSDLAEYTSRADILVVAAGVPSILTADMVKPGAAVIAAGVSYEGKKLLSDVDKDVDEVAGAITPRVGGVGPMTRAMLLSNTVAAAEKTAGL